MKKILTILTAVMLIFALSSIVAADEKKSEESFEFGGRMMMDWVFFGSADDDIETNFGPFNDGIEFRRARLYVKGSWGHVEFKVQYDFAGGDADFKDVYMKLKKLPFNITIGHFKEPFNLEELTSSKYITFMERSLPNMFAPGRNSGIKIDGNLAGKRIYYGVGIFRDANDYGEALDVDPTYNFTARLTATPIYSDKGKNLVHVGVAITARDYGDGGSVRFRQRPEVHIVDRFVNTGHFDANGSTIFGIEAAVVLGPLSVQGEYMSASVDASGSGDPTFDGYYVMASWWLTGEHRKYKESSAAFDRVFPKTTFMEDGGFGGLELAARYSCLNLSDADIDGGKLSDFTIGANWHLNKHTRIMGNFVMADHDDYGTFNTVMFRFQYDFKMKK
jgi:phosphate-selective porin OprO/OprP